ncbi:MAG: helix-turn-helix domain-containing protein [Thermodesulfobacteriota bacterium]
MTTEKGDMTGGTKGREEARESPGKVNTLLKNSIGNSIDMLVEYLADNNIHDIHPLIIGEVEKRLIIKALERSRGNKVQAARILGMSRNTFLRKIQKLTSEGIRLYKGRLT